MKEIDFLPEWYMAGKKRRVSYQRQYLVIGGLFLIMMLWSFAASCSISAVEGQVNIMQNSLDSHTTIAKKYGRYEQALVLLNERAERLKKLDTGINISAVFAELSFLASDQIVVTELEIKSEVFKDDSNAAKAESTKLGSGKNGKETAMPEADIRYKVMLAGIAASAADVTDYIAQLEKSSYFCLVVPGLLQNMSESTTTKFEISCYIANYIAE